MKFICLLLGAVILQLPGCSGARTVDGESGIGIYDSRAVAIAHVGSESFQRFMLARGAELSKAKEEGDEAALLRIEASMVSLQAKLHRQGFSTAPVDEILEEYTDQIDAILAEHRAAALVSRWDQKTLAIYPGSRRIDVTAELVNLITSNKKQRKRAMEIVQFEPEPLESIADHED